MVRISEASFQAAIYALCLHKHDLEKLPGEYFAEEVMQVSVAIDELRAAQLEARNG